MRKTFILDTNVLLHDPRAIFKFEDNDLIIPIYVIEEIDRFKRDTSERGRNAREVARLMDSVREEHGSLARGAPVGTGGTLTVYVPDDRAELRRGLADETSAMLGFDEALGRGCEGLDLRRGEPGFLL